MRFWRFTCVAVAILIMCAVSTANAGKDDSKIKVEVTTAQCPLVTTSDGVVYLLTGDDGVIPSDLSNGDSLMLTGNEVVSQPQLQDEACQVFDKVFRATAVKSVGKN